MKRFRLRGASGAMVAGLTALAVAGSQSTELVTKLLPADGQEGDFFGYTLAISGDTLIVTSLFDDDGAADAGAAYVFERDLGGADNWGERVKLLAPDADPGDEFGINASLFGDTLVVGALRDDEVGSDAGAAYVFERHAGGPDAWGNVAKLTAFDGLPRDFFGRAVTVYEDRVAVGAFNHDVVFRDDGAVYLFERAPGDPEQWTFLRKISAGDPGPGAFFGRRVALSADTLVVGAYGDGENGAEAGAAYVFERDAGGPNAWGQVQKLLASDGEAGDHFGRALDMEGDVLILGAHEEDAQGEDAGAAYVFERGAGADPNAWSEVAKLIASDGQAGDDLALGAGVSNGRVLLTARGDDDNGEDAGAAYLFQRDAEGGWPEVEKILAMDGAPGDTFGNFVAIGPSIAVIGAREDDDLGSDSGAVYIYDVSGADPLDSDGDGVSDEADNCLLSMNADQRDTDADNIGNACDPDFNGDCCINFVDLGELKAHFFAAGDLDTDLNGDHSTNFIDLSILKTYFLSLPGPSGLPNACDGR